MFGGVGRYGFSFLSGSYRSGSWEPLWAVYSGVGCVFGISIH